MSLLARVTDFTPGAVIASQPFDDEFDQLVNMLSGVSQNKSIRVISNDNAFAAARFDQRGNNKILELYGDGAEVWAFEKDGDIISPFLNSVAGIFTFASIPILPNSDPTTDNQAVRRKFVTDSRVAITATLLTDLDPNTAPGFTESGRFSTFVPIDGNAITIKRIWVKFQEGSHTAGGVVGYNIRIRNSVGAIVVDLGPVQLKDGQSTIHVPTVLDVADTALPAGGSVTIYRDATFSGTVSERSISAGYEGTQQRIN